MTVLAKRTPGFAEFLVARGAIMADDLPRLQQAAYQSGEAIHLAASKLGLGSEEELARSVSEYTGLPYIEARYFPHEAILANHFSRAFLKSAHLLPVAIKNGKLGLVVADPFNPSVFKSIEFATELKLGVGIGCWSDIDRAIDDLYEHDAAAAPGDPATGKADLVRLKELADEKPVIRFVSRMIETAAERQASDIHIEPSERGIDIRFRIDGNLEPAMAVPASIQTGLLSRIKIMAELDIGERRLPQDGRISFSARGRPLDLRVATTPTVNGESAVIRLLDPEAISFSLKALGFSPEAEASFARLLEMPHGVTLLTGPTGSGKTTTLYASLEDLRSDKSKILTVEDPVEYQLPGIQQIQVQPKIGLDFAAALRSILRHDPDILMVGEIRDLETAEIAIQFALTGHPVFSTLHTNGAAAAITRLLDMGVDAYLLTAAINGVVGQRLVRTLCRSCAEPDPDAATLVERIAPELARTAGFKRAVGCPDCRQTGFAGREAILEVMELTAEVKAMILDGASDSQLDGFMREQGMTGLLEDGLGKAARGVTSVAEVLRKAKLS